MTGYLYMLSTPPLVGYGPEVLRTRSLAWILERRVIQNCIKQNTEQFYSRSKDGDVLVALPQVAPRAVVLRDLSEEESASSLEPDYGERAWSRSQCFSFAEI